MYLLPVPRSLKEMDGAFELSLHTKIVLEWNPSDLARTAAKQLRDEIAASVGLVLDILCGDAREGDISLSAKAGEPAQGYTLSITAQGVQVCGNDAFGVINGVQTLRQIIRQSGWTLPALVIEDSPVYPARGFYHDVTRGRTPTMAWLKELADACCFYKINQLQLYIEHTYLYRDISEVWRVTEPLTAEDIMELDDYCYARGVELVPSLSSFGHLLELLRTKTYCDLCELENADQMPSTMPNRMHHHTLNVCDPRSLELVKKMISEFMPLFRSRLFNICADETFDLGKGRTREVMEQIGERNHYMGFVKALCQYVVEKGRTPMFWGDIVVRFADALSELPEGTICLNWGYSPRVKEDSTRTLAEAGATQYLCPGVSGWNQWMNQLRTSYDNITRMADYGRRYQAVGFLNTDWGDYGHINDPRFSIPGLIYGGHFSWSDHELSFEAINEAISHLEYTDRSGSVLSLLASLEGCDAANWHALVQYKDWKQGVWTIADGISPLAKRDLASVPAANAKLDELIAGLKKCAPAMDADKRAMLARWILIAEGMKLWNLTGAAVHEVRKDLPLANALENWLRLYEGMWREVSKESELWRIRDVTHWYADEMR